MLELKICIAVILWSECKWNFYSNIQYLSSLRLKQSQQELVELKRKADQEAREIKKEEEKKQEEEAKKVTASESITEKETKGENEKDCYGHKTLSDGLSKSSLDL